MQQIGHIIADGTAVARNGIATGTSAPVDRVAASAYVRVYIQSRTTAAPLLSRLPFSLLLPPNLSYPSFSSLTCTYIYICRTSYTHLRPQHLPNLHPRPSYVYINANIVIEGGVHTIRVTPQSSPVPAFSIPVLCLDLPPEPIIFKKEDSKKPKTR
jgi:hypothetical protein